MSQPFDLCNDFNQLNVHERMNYVLGQVLGVKEFQQEQAYFLHKSRLQNRSLHGYGTVWGLARVPGRKRRGCPGRSYSAARTRARGANAAAAAGGAVQRRQSVCAALGRRTSALARGSSPGAERALGCPVEGAASR